MQFGFFFLVALSLVFLPGNSFYETLPLKGGLAIEANYSYQALPSLPPLLVKSLTGEPLIGARSALLLDYNSGQILYQKNIDEALPMASLTKIMTALIVLEEMGLDQIATVNRNQSLGRTVGVIPGEQFLVRDLFYALLVMSGNDAADILADNFPGGKTAFVARMNEKATLLGLENTRFANPHGLDEANHYSSAQDLLVLTKYALKNDDFAKTIQRGDGQICNLTGDNCYQIKTTNDLLTFPGILGVKTGYTFQAGACFIGLWEQNGRRFLSVVLGSPNRFWETQNLLGWGLVSFSPQEVNLFDFLD